jgi:hypothetical protein
LYQPKKGQTAPSNETEAAGFLPILPNIYHTKPIRPVFLPVFYAYKPNLLPQINNIDFTEIIFLWLAEGLNRGFPE